MYRCTDCGAVFEKPHTYRESRPIGTELFSCCPDCNSTDFQEALQCKECGEYFIENKTNTMCDDCLKELEMGFSKILHDNYSDHQIDALNVIFDGRNFE